MNTYPQKRLQPGILAFLILISCLTAPSFAQSWGPRTSTYRGIVRVEARGNFTNEAGTAHSLMTVTDRSYDKNSVYGYTSFFSYGQKVDGKTDWVHQGILSTPEVENTTIRKILRRTMPWNHTKMRGEMAGCAQMGWPVPDSCTEPALLTIDY